jgi:putative ABC transport system permease protein
MIINFIRIASRQIRQSPLYSFINVASLAIGIASCLVIYLFIAEERSFDAFHTKGNVIYRLNEVQNFTGTNEQKVALSMPGMGPAILEEFPEVETMARFWNHGKQLVIHEEDKFLINNIAMADSTFLDVFDFPLLQGDRATALDEPNTILVTEETALRFFPSVDKAMNSVLRIHDQDFKISGILQNVPDNSHLQFNGLISLSSRTREDKDFNIQWGSNFLNTYLVLRDGADTKAMEAKFPAFLKKHMTDPDITSKYVLYLQRLTDVHLASTDVEHDYNNHRKFNGAYLDVFFLIGLFILLIASVNFMNLTTARASYRWKEVGVRKSIGAQKVQLMFQFIFESVILSLIALALSVILVSVLLPILNTLIGRQLELTLVFTAPFKIVILIMLVLFLGIITGLYPSIYMTSFKMTQILKGGNKSEGSRSLFRSSLIIVQFGLAAAMIVGTLVVVRQLSFMKNKDVGFKKDQMMLVNMNQEVNEKFETIKTELLKSSHFSGVTASGQRLGNNFHQWGFKVKADTGVIDFTPSNVNVEYDYLKVYGIQLKSGRGFSKDNVRDKGFAFVINESMEKELHLKEAVGTAAGHDWYHNDSLGTIIGVVKDFNFNSLHHKVNTLSLVVHPEWGYDEMSIRIEGANAEAAIAAAKEIWDKQITSFPFEYSFLDDHFSQLYSADKQMTSVVAIMAGIAILISCMGLFGLAAITTKKKRKEIGIRKTLGATEGQLMVLLSKRFMTLVVISFFLSVPLTWFVLSSWLEGFAYRINIDPLLFVISGVVVFGIAFLTITFHTIRSARDNPANALRYE